MNMKKVLSFACVLAITASVGTPYAFAADSTTDRSQGSAAVAQPTSNAAKANASIPTLTTKEAKSQGFDQILKGTVRVYNVRDLMKLEGAEKNVDLFKGECAVLMFDDATDVHGTSIATDKPQTTRAQLLGLAKDLEGDASHCKRDDGSVQPWKKLDGQRVTVGAKKKEIYYASEVSPFAENPIGSYGSIVLIKDAS